MSNSDPTPSIENVNVSATDSDRLQGIDSIRAIAAITVMIGHLSIFPDRILHGHPSGLLLAISKMVYNNSFNGPAAVIIFFVISGFCIHMPQTRRRSLDINKFYVRRAIRLGIPAICAISLFYYFGEIKLSNINDSVFWSVICEAIYYSIYPFLLILNRKISWTKIFLMSYLASLLLLLTHLSALQDPGPGYVALRMLTFIVGLPCWILGCWLAENRSRFNPIRLSSIWVWRIIIFSAAFATNFLRFHSHIVFFGACFTFNIFAIFVAIWIGFEVSSNRYLVVSSTLEWIGKWSYSLYLIHPIASALLARIGISSDYNSTFYHIGLVIFCFPASYIFYLLIERPAHLLAISVGRVRQPAYDG